MERRRSKLQSRLSAPDHARPRNKHGVIDENSARVVFQCLVLEKLGFEQYVEPSAYSAAVGKGCSTGCLGAAAIVENRWMRIWKDFKGVLPYLLIGILIGSVIYGSMPTDLITKYTGNDNISQNAAPHLRSGKEPSL